MYVSFSVIYCSKPFTSVLIPSSYLGDQSIILNIMLVKLCAQEWWTLVSAYAIYEEELQPNYQNRKLVTSLNSQQTGQQSMQHIDSVPMKSR